MMNKLRLFVVVSAGSILVASAVYEAAAQGESDASQAEDSTIEEVVVIGARVSLEKARDLERASDVWKNVVAADDIGNFPDQNVAESLQRLPGLSISRNEGEGRFVIVRGLSPAFNNVTINGVRLGATGEESRDNIASLDTIPSDLLNGIEVTKTSTADMDGDAIAGTINLAILSAFDRKNNSASLRSETSYNARAEKISPKLSGSFTRLFDVGGGDGILGIALTGSWFKRDIRLDDLRVARSSGNDLRAFDRGEGEFYRPEEIDQRLEVGTRTRFGGTANIEYRANADHSLYLNLTGSRLRDEDVRIQQEWETRRANKTSEVKVIGPNTGVFDDVDLEKQTFFKDTTSTVFSVSAGGKNTFNSFELTYQGDYSKSRYRNPLGTRGRFRERDELVLYTATSETVSIDATPDTAEYSRKKSGVDIKDPAKFNFDGILIDDVQAVDKIYSAKMDGKWNIEIFDRVSYIKTGVKFRSRKRFAEKEQLQIESDDDEDGTPGLRSLGFTQTLANAGTFDPKNTNLDNFGLIPSLAASQDLFNRARDARLAVSGFNFPSVSDDFNIKEEILAGYIMGRLELSNAVTVIAGIRLEQTKLDSDGTITETLRSCNDLLCDTNTNQQIGLGAVTESRQYTDVFPSFHIKYQPSDEVIMRMALTKAVKRPAFNENRPNIAVVTEEQEGGSYERTLIGGNSNLKTLRANQIDFLLSWYPNNNLALSGGVFYKDIKDFIVDVELSGDNVAQSGFPIADGTIDGGFDTVTTTINGEKASIVGLELSYFQAFDAIPGVFIDGNVTWTDSKSRIPLIDPDKKYKLPDQPKFVGNLSIGYEIRNLTLRLSGNYVGEKLETVASNPVMDEIRQSRFSADFGARYNFSKMLQIYFDAINLNNAKDVRVFRNSDNAPRMFESVQDYGRTFQVGVRANF